MKSLYVPAVTLAGLVLLMGTGLVFRSWIDTPDKTIAKSSESLQSAPRHSLDKPDVPATIRDVPGALAGKSESGPRTSVEPPAIKPRRQIRTSPDVASQRFSDRLAAREFSTTAAPVVKKEQVGPSLEPSAVFAVETTSGPLKVSLDYDTGVSRTISLPALSFGSERAFSGEASVIKTAAKGVW